MTLSGDPSTFDHVLGALGSISAYFNLEIAPVSDGDGLLPVDAYFNDGAPAPLEAAIDRVQQRIATSERWIAASILYRGWAYRLTSIYAGSIVLGLPVPDLSATGMLTEVAAQGPMRFVAIRLETLPPERAWHRLTEGHLDLLAEAIRLRVRIARRLLDGNLASALTSSLRTIARSGHGDLESLRTSRWATPARLAGLGDWRGGGEDLSYLRKTCCGYERLASRHRCADCSLLRREYTGL